MSWRPAAAPAVSSGDRRGIEEAAPDERSNQMPTDTSIEDDIRSAIARDARIPDPADIAVSVDNGLATLRGTVGSFPQRIAAARDARTVDGVYDVDDELEVRLLDEARREDADIRGVTLQSLMWDVEVPAESIDVKVENGWITLKGSVSRQYESDAAYDDVASLYGVYGITNEIKVETI
jgi:osmotically-inducible protein OsmY